MKKMLPLFLLAVVCCMSLSSILRAQDTIPLMSSTDDSSFHAFRSTYTSSLPLWTDTMSLLRLRLDGMKKDSARMDSALCALRIQNEQLMLLNDSLVASNDRYQQSLQQQNDLLESKITALQEKELLVAEKDALYRKALIAGSLDSAKYNYELRAKEASIEAKSNEIAMLQRNIDFRDSSLKNEKVNYDKLTAERNQCMLLVDSLREKVAAVELENVRKQEENKYLAQRAKDAEERVNTAINRKKKVRPVQGIAMRFYRTPNLEIALTPVNQNSDGTYTYEKIIRNRNEGNIEFDFVTGASVMLWDLTQYFNDKPDTLSTKVVDLRKFDQQFTYDIGFYVAFGGSNLFKNFYVGPSFRFVDFFYLTVGVNICEYEVLSGGYSVGQRIGSALSIVDVTAKTWQVKPFVSLSIDLDFLSYIKK
ncbi:MAG: hypothetical protein SPJ13_07990 [Bacteroidales bacterium]|nr:hypothetical protein [Bacteroidales bacterium]